MISDYLKYLVHAGNEHSLHSPFMYEFYLKVLKGKAQAAGSEDIEALRKMLLNDKREISITDFGAGSRVSKSNSRRISDIAKVAQKPAKLAKLFSRIVSYYQYKNIFDLGTSLGLTTAYLAKANPDGQVFTFEGCPNTAVIARENFKRLGIENVTLVEGNLDETLTSQLEKTATIDFAFFDANHRFAPTVSYFQACLPKAHEGTCFIFDDIYWSDEMKKAWEYIRNHPQSTVTIDIFSVGIVFFRSKQPKQHFTLRF